MIDMYIKKLIFSSLFHTKHKLPVAFLNCSWLIHNVKDNKTKTIEKITYVITFKYGITTYH